MLYWKDFTSIFQDGDSRPYWVLLCRKFEEWGHLVNLLVSDTVASKVYIVIQNKVPLVSIFVLKYFFNTLFSKQR